MVNFAFRKICPFIVVVVSSPLQTRFICFRISSGIAWPSAEPDTIDQVPCSCSMSFLKAESSAACVQAITAANATNQIDHFIKFLSRDSIGGMETDSCMRLLKLG